MSLLLLLAMSAAAAASAGYFAARRRKAAGFGDDDAVERRDPRSRPPDPIASQQDASPAPKKNKKKKVDPFAELPFALGDVVVGDGERWLAGAVLAREGDRVIGALFVAPEGAKQLGVAAFAAPRRDVFWLAPADVDSPGEPPATLEIRGIALRREGRLPVAFERVGQGAPQVGEEGMWAVYDGGGRDVALVLTSGGHTFGYAGVRLDEGQYDRLGAAGED
jgi:hypothetical protein